MRFRFIVNDATLKPMPNTTMTRFTFVITLLNYSIDHDELKFEFIIGAQENVNKNLDQFLL